MSEARRSRASLRAAQTAVDSVGAMRSCRLKSRSPYAASCRSCQAGSGASAGAEAGFSASACAALLPDSFFSVNSERI